MGALGITWPWSMVLGALGSSWPWQCGASGPDGSNPPSLLLSASDLSRALPVCTSPAYQLTLGLRGAVLGTFRGL